LVVTRRNTTLELARLKTSTIASNDWLPFVLKVFDSRRSESFTQS
jgi:hypothetical protein